LREINIKDLPEGFETSFDLVGQDPQATLLVLEDFEGNILAAAEMYGNEIHTIEALEKRKGYAGTKAITVKCLLGMLQEEQDYLKMKKVCDECKPFAEAMGFIPIENSSDWDWEYEEED
jgi:hypothetical protein